MAGRTKVLAIVCGVVLATAVGTSAVVHSWTRVDGGRRQAASGDTSSPTSQRPSTIATTSSTAVTTSIPANLTPLVSWSGPVEHLFFHTLIVDPKLAFAKGSGAQRLRDYFVTVKEFRAILNQLDANNWTLVDIHRVAAGTVRVPVGRRPVVISEDDVNYYDYDRTRGLGWKLALDEHGNVKVEVHEGAAVRLSDDDLIPIIDEFVTTHPGFSAEGAKGVVALTGFQGLFGEHMTNSTEPERSGAVGRAAAIAARLKATGWTLANHSWGHIDLNKLPTADVLADTQRWKAEAETVTGPTDVYIYPFGARPPPTTLAMLRDQGYALLCDIDIVARLVHGDGVTIMSRRHIDGIAFGQPSSRLAPFFDVASVVDSKARRG